MLFALPMPVCDLVTDEIVRAFDVPGANGFTACARFSGSRPLYRSAGQEAVFRRCSAAARTGNAFRLNAKAPKDGLCGSR